MFRWYERRESHPDTLMTSSLCQLLSRLAQVIIQISLIAITVIQPEAELVPSLWQCGRVFFYHVCLTVPGTICHREEGSYSSTSSLLCTSVSHYSTRLMSRAGCCNRHGAEINKESPEDLWQKERSHLQKSLCLVHTFIPPVEVETAM